MFQILLLEQVIDEIQETHDWYEEQRDGLGEELIEEVRKSYQKLSEHPQHYSFGGKQLRRLKISRFPYFFIYRIVNKEVLISKFIHAKRKRNGK